MLKIATFLVLSTIFSTVETHAQNRTLEPLPRRAAKTFRKDNPKVTAELQRQQKLLQNIAARYEEVSTYDLTPLLKYPYVWSALRENRARVVRPQAEMTASQSRLFLKAYDLLEEETLMSFLDHQISILSETLDLEEAQQEEIQKVLTIDLSNKRLLLSSSMSGHNFHRRLDSLSSATEKKILAILFPEQRRVFDSEQSFKRNRMVG